MSKEKLGTCDLMSELHPQNQHWRNDGSCVNFREQPQGEPSRPLPQTSPFKEVAEASAWHDAQPEGGEKPRLKDLPESQRRTTVTKSVGDALDRAKPISPPAQPSAGTARDFATKTYGQNMANWPEWFVIAEAFAAQQNAQLRQERDALKKENKRLILQYTVADNYWYDGDAHFDSPEEYADEQNLKVGEEFELTASTYWEEKFRVIKVPDEKNDDYECETISKQREEFETYQQMEQRCDRAESALREVVFLPYFNTADSMGVCVVCHRHMKSADDIEAHAPDCKALAALKSSGE